MNRHLAALCQPPRPHHQLTKTRFNRTWEKCYGFTDKGPSLRYAQASRKTLHEIIICAALQINSTHRKHVSSSNENTTEKYKVKNKYFHKILLTFDAPSFRVA